MFGWDFVPAKLLRVQVMLLFEK